MEKSIQSQIDELKADHAKKMGDFIEADAKDAEMSASLQEKLNEDSVGRVVELPPLVDESAPTKSWFDTINEEYDRKKGHSASTPDSGSVAAFAPEPIHKPASTASESIKIPAGSLRSPETPESQPQAEYESFKQDFVKKHGAKGGLSTIFDTLEYHQDFLDLSPGKKMLVAQSVIEDLHTKVKTEAQKTFQKKATESTWMGNVPVVGWLGKKLKAVAYGLNKNALTKKYEQNALMDMTYMSDGDYINAVGQKYIRGYAEQNLDAIYRGNGKVEIDFAKTKEFGESDAAKVYNEAANVFARIPQAWGVEKTATKEQYRAWHKAKVNFDDAANLMTPLFRDHAKEGEFNKHMQGAIDANFAKRQVEFFSFISQNPDTANELRKTATSNGITRTLDSLKKFGLSYTNWNRIASLVTGAGVRVGVGAGVSTALAGTALGGAMIAGAPIVIGAIAAAAAGGTVGYFFRGDKIAKDRFKQQAIDARTGELSLKARQTQPGTLASVSRIKRRTEQMQKLTKKLSDLGASDGSAIEVAELSNQLQVHLNYIKQKIEDGEMNFGDADSQYTNYVSLMMAQQEADIALSMTARNYFGLRSDAEREEFDSLKKNDNKNDRRLDLLSEIETKGITAVEEARKEAVKIQKKESARIGALFGAIGSYASQWFYSTDAGHAVREATQGVVGAVKGGASVVEPEVKHIPSAETAHTPTNTSTQNIPAHKIETGKPSPAPGSVARDYEQPTDAPGTGGTKIETAPNKITEGDIENAFTKIKIKKGEGMGDALLKLRNTPSFKNLIKTNPNVAKFFQGNIWEKAEALHAFRPGNTEGDSLVIGEGSEIGITKNGDIFVKNTQGGGKTQILGHIDPQTGKFSEVSPDDTFQYRNPKQYTPAERPVQATENESPRPQNDEEGPDSVLKPYPHNKEEGPVGEKNTKPEQEVNEEGPDSVKEPYPHNGEEGPDSVLKPYPHNREEGPVVENTAPQIKNTDNFTKSDWNRVHNISYRDMHNDLNQYFGKRNLIGEPSGGERSLIYKSLSNRDAGSIMKHFKQHSNEFKPEVQKFLKHIQALSVAHSHISPAGKFGQYIENLYKADATEFVAKNPNSDPR